MTDAHPILLVLSTTRQSPATVSHALARAKDAHEPLHVVFILDSEVPNSIFDRLTDMGFVGERPSQQLSDAIMTEYRDRGGTKLQEIEHQCCTEGVTCSSALLEGEFVPTCLNQIRLTNAREVVLTRQKRGNISRYLFGSAVNDLKCQAPCPVIVIDEDD